MRDLHVTNLTPGLVLWFLLDSVLAMLTLQQLCLHFSLFVFYDRLYDHLF